MPGTLSSNTLRMAVVALERLGHDVDPILEACQIPRRTIDNLWARIPIEKERKFWRLAVERSGDAQIGLRMGSQVPFGTFPLLEYVGASCESNLQALHLLARYSKIVYGGWNPEIEEQTDRIEFRLGADGDSEECRCTTEFTFTVLWDRLRSFSSEDFSPVAVHFRHEAAEPRREYTSRFGQCVEFDQPEDMIVLPDRIRDIPCKNSNPLALGSLLYGVDKMFAKLSGENASDGGQDLISKIKAEIAARISAGEVGTEEIARRLNLSRRTLQRKLETEGRSLRALTSEVRREIVTKLLRESDQTVEEIGLSVGYSDFRAFNRAFRAWYGMSPGAFRRGQGKS